MTDHDDAELERRVRASLDTHAAEVDTSVPVATRARAAARRHRNRWVVGGLVAAAVVAAVVVPVVFLGRDDVTRVVEPSGPLPAQWRTELWHGISVDVPAAWGWDASPHESDGLWVRCGQGESGYVGRPIGTTDMCQGLKEVPTGDYVWLGSPVPVGAEDLQAGYAQETVEVAGERVTVVAKEPALRERIVSSVAAQDLCPATVDPAGVDLGNVPVDGVGELRSAHLCAYTRLYDAGDPLELTYGRELPARAFGRFQRALDRAPRNDRRCKATSDLVVVTAVSDDAYADVPVTRTWVADLTCDTVASSYGMRSVTIAVIASLADAGLRVSLPALIPPQG